MCLQATGMSRLLLIRNRQTANLISLKDVLLIMSSPLSQCRCFLMMLILCQYDYNLICSLYPLVRLCQSFDTHTDLLMSTLIFLFAPRFYCENVFSKRYKGCTVIYTFRMLTRQKGTSGITSTRSTPWQAAHAWNGLRSLCGLLCYAKSCDSLYCYSNFYIFSSLLLSIIQSCVLQLTL